MGGVCEDHSAHNLPNDGDGEAFARRRILRVGLAVDFLSGVFTEPTAYRMLMINLHRQR